MYKYASLLVLSSLLLAGWLVIIAHPTTGPAIRSTLVTTLLVTAIHYFLQSAGRPYGTVAGAILWQSAFGSLGMSLGAWLDGRSRMSCCLSVFNIDQLLSWPTLLMFLFCYLAARWPQKTCSHRVPHDRKSATCGWLSLPMMYIGMCLAGKYGSPLLKAPFGIFLAMHWAMFLGMAAGHGINTVFFTLSRPNKNSILATPIYSSNT